MSVFYQYFNISVNYPSHILLNVSNLGLTASLSPPKVHSPPEYLSGCFSPLTGVIIDSARRKRRKGIWKIMGKYPVFPESL